MYFFSEVNRRENKIVKVGKDPEKNFFFSNWSHQPQILNCANKQCVEMLKQKN